MFFDCGHKSESRPQKEEGREKEEKHLQLTQLTWDTQRCWTCCSLEERNEWKKSLLMSFIKAYSFFSFFFHNNVRMASSQYLAQHPASLSLDLTKMKVCVAPQVDVAMETTVIQCSRQWLLNKRSCLMELKSRPGSSSPAICAGSISSRAAEGEWVAYISSSASRPRTQPGSPPITVAESVLWVRLVNNGKQPQADAICHRW